jgi:alpha-glucosidase
MPWRGEALYAGFSTVDPWLPIDPRHPALSVDRQERDPGSMLQATRELIALRKAHPALRHGDMRILQAADDLLCFERSLGGERLTCVFNLGHDAAAWVLPDGQRIIKAVNAEMAVGDRLPPLAGLVLARNQP